MSGAGGGPRRVARLAVVWTTTLLASAVSAQVYRCAGKDGHITYQQQPCDGAGAGAAGARLIAPPPAPEVPAPPRAASGDAPSISTPPPEGAAPAAPAKLAPDADPVQACMAVTRGVLQRRADLQRLRKDGEVRAINQQLALSQPNTRAFTAMPDIRGSYAAAIARIEDELRQIDHAARTERCPIPSTGTPMPPARRPDERLVSPTQPGDTVKHADCRAAQSAIWQKYEFMEAAAEDARRADPTVQGNAQHAHPRVEADTRIQALHTEVGGLLRQSDRAGCARLGIALEPLRGQRAMDNARSCVRDISMRDLAGTSQLQKEYADRVRALGCPEGRR